MAMSTYSTVSLICDRCQYTTYSESLRNLTDHGWAMAGWPGMQLKHLCPMCAAAATDFWAGRPVPQLVRESKSFDDLLRD